MMHGETWKNEPMVASLVASFVGLLGVGLVDKAHDKARDKACVRRTQKPQHIVVKNEVTT
jgi:hypothetical protein